MIKINLLKSFTSSGSGGNDAFSAMASSAEKDKLIVEAAKRLAIVLIGPAALYLYELQALPTLENKLKAKQAEVSETVAFNQSKSGLAAEIKKYEEEQTKINLQMNFISRIARDKINEFKLFQHLQVATPESVWINRLEFKNNELSINAESDVTDELNKFSVRLSNTEFLTNIIPIDQDIKTDPYGIGVSTTSQNLKAKFSGEANSQ